MKKYISILVLFIASCFKIFASPADSSPFKTLQPNGDTICISLHGDEYGSWYEDDKGNVIALNSAKYWVYVSVENGKRLLTNQIVETSQLIIK